MAGPSNRRHARYPCEIPVQVRAPRMKNRLFDGIMLDVGMGGALISVLGNVEGPLLYLEYLANGQPVSIKTRIARSIGPDKKRRKHYLVGVAFEADLSNQHHLRALIDAARKSKWSASTGTESGELRRDYWKI